MQAMNHVDVFVPARGAHFVIDHGSGIVGTPLDSGALLIDYEGNRYGASNVVTYADRVHLAAGRHLERYPTIARQSAAARDLVRIGSFDTTTGYVDLTDGGVDEAQALVLLAGWLGLPVADIADQLWTTSYRHLAARGLVR